MPINQSVLNFDDDLENRIKSLCHDPLPKDAVRRIQQESNQRAGMIYPGAKFSGFQTSSTSTGTGIAGSVNSGYDNDQRYEVTVEFQSVDMINSLLSGYLTISNLTTVNQSWWWCLLISFDILGIS